MLMAMFLVGRHVLLPVVTGVIVESPAWDAGVKWGDRIQRLGDQPIETFEKLKFAVVEMEPNTPVSLVVERDGRHVALTISRPKKRELGVFCGSATLEIEEVNPVSPAGKAGLQPGDVLVSVDGRPLRSSADFRQQELASPGRPLRLGIERAGRPVTIEVEPRAIPTPDPGFTIRVPREVGFVRKGFPAEGKLKQGDRITEVNGKAVDGWWDIEEAVAEGPDVVVLKAERGAEAFEIELPRQPGPWLIDSLGVAPRPTYIVESVHGQSTPPLQPGDEIVKAGKHDMRESIRHGLLYEPPEAILAVLGETEHITVRRGDAELEVALSAGERQVGDLGIQRKVTTVFRQETLLASIVPALEKTAEAAKLVYVILRKLVQADVKGSGVAGPLGILQITYISATQGLSQLFYLVGMITVNIGVLNLLPLPPLDGGRLLLLAYEKLRGRAPSRKVQEALIMTGVVLLLGVILLATFNDVKRIFF